MVTKAIYSRRAVLCMICLLLISDAFAADWPAWRGPLGSGICEETGLPLKWSRTENVKWRVALPEPGNSTPIVSKGRVFLTQAVGKDRVVMCCDRSDGRLLWQQAVMRAMEPSTLVKLTSCHGMSGGTENVQDVRTTMGLANACESLAGSCGAAGCGRWRYLGDGWRRKRLLDCPSPIVPGWTRLGYGKSLWGGCSAPGDSMPGLMVSCLAEGASVCHYQCASEQLVRGRAGG
jgi:hypothetical protein